MSLVIDLQQITLDAVERLVIVQQELQAVKKQRLEVEREKLQIEKIKLLASGITQNSDGDWVVRPSYTEQKMSLN